MKLSGVFNLKSLIREKLLPDKKIRIALSSNFPQALDVEWSVKNNNYVATFIQEGNYTVASFDEIGILKEKMISLTEKQLPTAITNIIHSKFEMLFLVNALEIKKAEKSTYELIIDTKDKSRYQLHFDENASLIKEQLLFTFKQEILKGKKNF